LAHIAGSSKVLVGAPRGPFPNFSSRFLRFAGVLLQRVFVQHDRHLASIGVPGDFPNHSRESLPLGFWRKKRPCGGEPKKEFARPQGIAVLGFDIREAGERIEDPILERPRRNLGAVARVLAAGMGAAAVVAVYPGSMARGVGAHHKAAPGATDETLERPAILVNFPPRAPGPHLVQRMRPLRGQRSL